MANACGQEPSIEWAAPRRSAATPEAALAACTRLLETLALVEVASPEAGLAVKGRSLARNIGRLARKAANFGASLCSMNFNIRILERDRPTGCVSAETGSIPGTRKPLWPRPKAYRTRATPAAS
jgi:hypothetical protein